MSNKTKPFKFRPRYNVDGCGPGYPTNGKRAKWAEEALLVYRKGKGYETDDDPSDPIADLIGDLLHLCDREKIDAEYTLERARGMWFDER